MKLVKKSCVVLCIVCSCCLLVISCQSLTEPDKSSGADLETVIVTQPDDGTEKTPSEEAEDTEDGDDATEAADTTGYCRGDELLCLPTMTAELVRNANGNVHGGTFSNGTFKPSSTGGISFSLTVDTSKTIEIEFDIKNNIPNWTKGEHSGGKVSLATLEESSGDYYLSLQRMYRSYRGGGVFRAILTDRADGREDGSAFVITTSSLAGHYSMSRWGNETHSFKVSLKGNACQLRIDSYRSRSASAPYSIGGRKRVRFILGNRELSRMGMGEGALTRFIRVKVTN